jgi:phosphoribosylformylglycinamidine synthase
MDEQKSKLEFAKTLGLTESEFKKICEILNREPNELELGIFSALWNEHTSYKSSKIHIKNFYSKNKNVLQGPGENAGCIDIGDNQALVFKMESHNHPSYIEPFQGAATGVGGILRDIFTMGARPIALLDSLRFGSTDFPKTKYLVDRVVAGISFYGNCIGVPTVGGEVYFNSCYNQNILVNVLCLGIADINKLQSAKAKGTGNPIIYVGSKTGRDGIHGASMASSPFERDTHEKLPTVQVGDPFSEKLLVEACLELFEKDYLIGIQDMGAAGLTCSIFEMSERGNCGMEIDLNKIPVRAKNMSAFEIMLSESQERMLLCVKKGFENKVVKIFEKWDLDCACVGHTIEENKVKLSYKNDAYELPVKPLTSEAPIYERKIEKQINLNKFKFNEDELKEPEDYNNIIIDLISQPNMASKEWVYRQYDHMVMTNTVLLPGADASVLQIKGTTKAIAVTCDCNSMYCYMDPYKGSKIACAEAVRNLACVGARPLAITDCLNFGNPENPNIMWQFTRAVHGINEAALFFDTPIISGNVSFYNEGGGENIFPTPLIGMAGLIKDFKQQISCGFKKEEDLIILLGKNNDKITACEYLYKTFGNDILQDEDLFPEINLEDELNLSKACIDAIENKIINSAHDCSEGGIVACLIECIVTSKSHIGAKIDFKKYNRFDFWLFNENQGRIIVTISPNNLQGLEKIAKKNNIPMCILGETIGNSLVINNKVNIPISDLKKAYSTGFEKAVFKDNT